MCFFGVGSAGVNAWNGDWGAAAVDLGGVAVDTASVFVPFVPRGAAAGIKAGREAVKATKAGKQAGSAAERASNVAKGIPETQLGPSGKPKQHTASHSSRKSAREAAKKEADNGGGSVRHDGNPSNSKQSLHFQAEDAKGENVKPVVHHEHPDK